MRLRFDVGVLGGKDRIVYADGPRQLLYAMARMRRRADIACVHLRLPPLFHGWTCRAYCLADLYPMPNSPFIEPERLGDTDYLDVLAGACWEAACRIKALVEAGVAPPTTKRSKRKARK